MEANQPKEELVIRPSKQWGSINFKELWQYRDLTWLYIKRDLVVRYKQTILGPLWVVISPLLTSVVFTIVFGIFAGLPTDGIPQFLFYLSSNVIWGLLSSGVTGTSNTFVLNSSIFGKVYFPRLVVPVAQIGLSFITTLIQVLTLLIFYTYYALTGMTATLSWGVLWIPVLLLQCMLLALGVGLILSAVTAKYRDLTMMVSFGLQLWMYLSPVVYTLDTAGRLERILMFNPMTSVIVNFRYALFGVGEFLYGNWLFSWGITIALLVLGFLTFGRVEKDFIDTV